MKQETAVWGTTVVYFSGRAFQKSTEDVLAIFSLARISPANLPKSTATLTRNRTCIPVHSNTRLPIEVITSRLSSKANPYRSSTLIQRHTSAMASVYTSFLQSPSASVLAANASLNYISTTTTIHEPAAILKHLQAQAKQLQKKDEKVLSTIEGDHGVCVETETTLQFTSGGGAFLPGIDENLLDEKTVVFPMVHVVTLDADKKITQIRLYWEQGTLLRQIEAIGRTGRNWPIRDGKALVDTVKNSLKAAGHDTSANGSLALSDPSQIVISEREKSGSISATRDPHASLSLFSPRDPNKESERSYDGPATAPRASAKPAPRDYSELFAGEEEEAPTGSAQRSLSPSKMDGRDMKANSGKHFTANRIFDESSPLDPPKSPERKKTYGQKYEHFAFGDGEDEPHDTRPRSKGSKGMSHFSFEDFSTPPSVKEKPRPDYERHWGAGVDEVSWTPSVFLSLCDSLILRRKSRPDLQSAGRLCTSRDQMRTLTSG